MFQAIFIFFDWISIKQIIVSPTPFVLAGTYFLKLLPGILSGRLGAWAKMHRFSTFSGNVNTINWKDFPRHFGIYKSEKIQQAICSGAERDKTLNKLKKYERMYPWG